MPKSMIRNFLLEDIEFRNKFPEVIPELVNLSITRKLHLLGGLMGQW